ncbi:transposase [Streptomyces sp. NPDC001068]|uniref:transposase n=1 Tax=Streptomyces sp. NPDC001068 TaxID=3364544 RepID=UPI0036832B2B
MAGIDRLHHRPCSSACCRGPKGGNTDDCTQFTAVMEAVRVPRTGSGRPRLRPDLLIADKRYSSKAIRAWLRRRGVAHTIAGRADRIRNRARLGNRAGRPPAGIERQGDSHAAIFPPSVHRLPSPFEPLVRTRPGEPFRSQRYFRGWTEILATGNH